MKFSLLFCSYILSFFYILFLIIIYFSKNRLDNLENRIYKRLFITNIIGIVIQLICEIVSILNIQIILCIITKLLLIYFIIWIALFLLYVLEISNTLNNKLKITNLIIIIISCFLIIILPYKSYIDANLGIYYTLGLDTKYTYLISIIYITIISFITLLKHTIISSKKAIPIYLLIIFFIIAGLIQYRFPQITIIVQIETFICLVMYFTIENPDLKMIEELNIAKDIADKANNAKTDFLSSMSHEIRTPLNAIVGFSESLKEEELPPKAKDEVDDIISASQTLLEIVNGILDISKIEANKLEIVDCEYDTQSLFKELANLTKVRIGEKPINLNVMIDESMPAVLYGDYTRLKQIILNLLTNAAKYTDKGQIDFTVNSVKSGDVCRLIISVKDTGRGIKQENIDKLFTKFERLDEKNSTIEGTGLGLAITKKLINLMNGSIVVKSTYGEGSNFIVSLDQLIVKNPTIKKTEEIVNDNVNNYKGKRILIVDDNELNLKVAVRLLQPYEMNIDQINNGDGAIDKIINGNVYDLILLDDMMPHKSGSETLAELKQISGFNMPVVVLTANAIEGMKQKYLDMGFDDYLAKPIAKEELKRVLQKYLNK